MFLIFLILLFTTTVNATWYQVQKFSYEENATTATWTYAGDFSFGSSTTTINSVIKSSGSVRSKEVVANTSLKTPEIDFSVTYCTNTAPSKSNLIIISSRAFSLWMSTGTGTKAWIKIGGQ